MELIQTTYLIKKLGIFSEYLSLINVFGHP
jgi:hypothetical protein